MGTCTSLRVASTKESSSEAAQPERLRKGGGGLAQAVGSGRSTGGAEQGLNRPRAFLLGRGRMRPREGSDGDEGLEFLEAEGELPARPPGRGSLRPLQVHVPTTGARRLSLSPGADSRLSHLRSVHTSPLTRPNGPPIGTRSQGFGLISRGPEASQTPAPQARSP
jgi:hypothetical protein